MRKTTLDARGRPLREVFPSGDALTYAYTGVGLAQIAMDDGVDIAPTVDRFGRVDGFESSLDHVRRAEASSPLWPDAVALSAGGSDPWTVAYDVGASGLIDGRTMGSAR